MLSREIVEQIVALAREGLSNRKICKVLNISRNPVDKYVQLALEGKLTDEWWKSRYGDNETKSPDHTKPPQRCPDCGNLVYMPCLSCRVLAWRAGNDASVPNTKKEEPLLLKLNSLHAKRYKALRDSRGSSPDPE